MGLDPQITDLGSKVRLDWTPDLSGQGYRLYVDGVAVSRTFKPNAHTTEFSKPDQNPHRYGVQKMDVVDALEEVVWPESGVTPAYLADFETGDFSQVVSQQESSTGRITLTTSDPLQGRYSALITNGPVDVGVAGAGSSLRTEIAFQFFGDEFGGSLEGKESWVTWDEKLDAAFQIGSGFCIITQFHGGTGSPVFAIEADPPAPDGVLYTIIRGGDVNANYRAIPIAKPVPRGMLMRFKVFHHWSTGPSGRVKVWLNYALVVDDQGPNLYKGNESGPYHKGGVYRSASGVTNDSQLLIDDIRWYKSDPGS